MPEHGPVDRRIVPSTLPEPQKRWYQPKAKAGPETSTIDIDHVDLPITTIPSLDAPEAEGPGVPSELKLSPIDLINKRLKTTSKKIARITSYASTNPRYLNADQKRFLKTLPTLEAIQKELNDVKKAIEMHAADELITKNLGTEKTESAKIADTIAAVQVDVAPQHTDSQLQKGFVTRTIDLINVLRYSLLASGKLDALSTDETEGSIVYGIADALLGTDDDKRRATVEGFLQGSGNLDGISYSLFVQIAKAGLALPHETQEETVVEPEIATSVIIPGIPRGLPKTKGINFIQESEIESFGISGGRQPVHAWTEFAEELQRKPVGDRAAAEAEQKKREEQRKQEDLEEQKWPEEWRLVDQLKRDRAEAGRKRREEEQRKREEEQKWPDEWRLVDQLKQDRAEKTEAWKSRGAIEWEPSSSNVPSWTELEMQTWDDDESMGAEQWPRHIWPSLITPARQGSNATWAVGLTRWRDLEALRRVREVKASEMGKSSAQVGRRSTGEWH